VFDLQKSQEDAQARFVRVSRRRRRSDAGASRLHPAVLAHLRSRLLGRDRPSMADLRRELAAWCGRRGFHVPSRATLYNLLPHLEGHSYAVEILPGAVRRALYNLAPDAKVPGHQLVFHCLNYGSLAAVSAAATLPWLDLYQAAHLRGWRARSRGLLTAILRARGIR
jgi:hypothetical protein